MLHLEWSKALIGGGPVRIFCNSGEAFGRGEKIENSRYAADPGVSKNESVEDAGVSSSQASSAQYSCKKCKRVIACQENVIPHDPISGESSFRWRRRGVQRWGGEDDDPACTALFVEPMQWMSQGKLNSTSFFKFSRTFLQLISIDI